MKTKNNTNLFFLELIFSIFFFVIVSTICLEVFSKAHFLNNNSLAMTHTLEIVQNEINLFYNDCHCDNQITFNDTVLYYSTDFLKSDSASNAEYCLSKNYSIKDDIIYMDITFKRLSDSYILYQQQIIALQ